MNWLAKLALLLPLAVSAQSGKGVGVSVAERAVDNSPEAEMASFHLADGYAVNLFASEQQGIANPIAIRWDPAGRLWVLTTLAYAQVEPGSRTSDRLLILEDTDDDGSADQVTTFVEGLNMPTGFALGHGGVYVGEGEDLVFLQDTNGDDRADTQTIVLTGFGTGDTHQNINSFSWGPAGDLWFSIGLHNFSRVETPWGIVRGEEAGFFRLRVKELKLEPFCMGAMMAQNPWGITWDRWGAMFVKSNNTEIGFASPGVIPTDHYRELMLYGAFAATPGKSMGGEVVESSHLPADLQNHVLIAGYFANRVTATPLGEEGSGFQRVLPKDLLVSSSASFRPVEVKVGPDGAIYVADWYNPIIGHYQASLRHSGRDKTHGRIWRITAQDRPLVRPPDLIRASARELLQTHLQSPEKWVRYQARRRLADMPPAEFERGLGFEPEGGMQTLEAAWARESQGFAFLDDRYIRDLLKSKQPHVRAYAARMIGRWATEWEDPFSLLETAIGDAHPRVRLEAIVSASHLNSAEAMKIALLALEQPVDKFIDYSLSQCVHALAGHWLPALRTGELTLDKQAQLVYAVSHHGGPEAAEAVSSLLEKAPPASRDGLYRVLARVGNPEDLRTAFQAMPMRLEMLEGLYESLDERRVHPAGDLEALLGPAMSSRDPEVLAAALRLVEGWKVNGFSGKVRQLAEDPATMRPVRHRAFFALARLEGNQAADFLSRKASEAAERPDRRVAAEALAVLDLKQAAAHSARLLADCTSEAEAGEILSTYLSRRGGSEALAEALASVSLDPFAATCISQSLTRSGRSDEELVAVVNTTLGLQSGARDYSEAFVRELVAEVEAFGKAGKGKEIYHSPLLNCAACHQLNGEGGILGPDLTTVGAGLSTDLLIESVLWPARQLKEGYFSMNVTTKDGRLYNGYRQREENGVLWLRDIATRKTVPIQLDDIVERNNVGTLMPGGLTASLSREELRDLIRFLSEQRGTRES